MSFANENDVDNYQLDSSDMIDSAKDSMFDTDIESDPIQRTTDIQDIHDLAENRKKNFFSRNLSPITPGGIRSSVFTLFSGTVGAGVLSLPHITSYFGLGLGCVLIVIAAYMNYCSYMLLNEAVVSSRKKSFPNICSFYLGKRYAQIFTYILFMTNFMACTIYTTICKFSLDLTDLAWGFMESLINEYITLPVLNGETGEFDEYSGKMWLIRITTMMGLATLMLAINLRKEFSGLRYVSVLILFSILLTIVVSFLEYSNFNLSRLLLSKLQCIMNIITSCNNTNSISCHQNQILVGSLG
jgi:amino acid permease